MQPLLNRYSIRPKKKLGQNFLTDAAVLRREVACADIAASDTVLEIGAGIGNLTELLLERAGQVVAVEQDRQFYPVSRRIAAAARTSQGGVGRCVGRGLSAL